jgi:hypothetical protein
MANYIAGPRQSRFGEEIWIEVGPGNWWSLFINGKVYKQSADHDFIQREFNSRL